MNFHDCFHEFPTIFQQIDGIPRPNLCRPVAGDATDAGAGCGHGGAGDGGDLRLAHLATASSRQDLGDL